MRLGSLVEELDVEVAKAVNAAGDLDTSVTGVAIDNRKVAPGTVIGAVQG
ncbi:MAG: UDP-N-acetylmuramoyl-L-alanyl-D-glutamate--2,6-diaminopimelate ligase, partial [Pseudomonadota bacterium]|nr:UDP-N-acetylmuramoyl-L-alanyl-D-glutamate--2,6-diaminopimelate ligase [Pseudomonadota bacterium]